MLNRRMVRARFEERFSAERMTRVTSTFIVSSPCHGPAGARIGMIL